eukprot:UN27752
MNDLHDKNKENTESVKGRVNNVNKNLKDSTEIFHKNQIDEFNNIKTIINTKRNCTTKLLNENSDIVNTHEIDSAQFFVNVLTTDNKNEQKEHKTLDHFSNDMKQHHTEISNIKGQLTEDMKTKFNKLATLTQIAQSFLTATDDLKTIFQKTQDHIDTQLPKLVNDFDNKVNEWKVKQKRSIEDTHKQFQNECNKFSETSKSYFINNNKRIKRTKEVLEELSSNVCITIDKS